MSLVTFEAHLNHPAPAFRCFAAGKSKKAQWIARVTHKIERPASKKSLAKLDQYLGEHGSQIRRFYALHNGLTLYCDTLSDTAGVAFFKIDEWKKQSKAMREFMLAEQEDADWPDWFLQGYAFAEIPHSANYFVIDKAGQVFYMDHDAWEDAPIAKTFSEFLDLIVKNPARFLRKRGCYTHYSDGKTKKRWIPKEYLSDCNEPKS